MFIVARRLGQRILIGDDIEVVVTELSRSTVKLGITAPRPFFIMRGELKDSVAQANREALTAQLEAPVLDAEAPTEAESTQLVSVRTFLKPSVNTLTQSNATPETAGTSPSQG